jgi:peptidoglycan/LPS O-acetylase OafA/YrhL
MSSPRPLGEARVPALDGLRGIAILLVMIYHQTVAVGSTLLDRFVGFWTLGGWVGVDLFFVLSGFLITGILYDSKTSRGYFKNFYARRVLRIFPLYFAVVAVSLVILPHIPNWKSDSLGRINGDEIWYWTYLSNFSIAAHSAFRHGILDVSWSLAIEEQFYLSWPVLVFLLPRRTLLALCGAVVALAVTWRTALLLAGAAPIAVFVLTPGRIDALAIGAFVALVARGPEGLAALRGWAAPAAGAAAIGVVGIAALAGGFDPYVGAMQMVGYTGLALFFGGVLVLTLTASPRWGPLRVLHSAPLTTFGKYSYALYLFHLPLRAIIRDKVYGPDQFLTLMGSPLPGQVIFYVGATLVALAAAWLSWHLYEKHFLALKRYFAPARAAAASAVRATPHPHAALHELAAKPVQADVSH